MFSFIIKDKEDIFKNLIDDGLLDEFQRKMKYIQWVKMNEGYFC